jgi:mRNA-degrading endonuclease toxin of MazEF toxin-antitoxin module
MTIQPGEFWVPDIPFTDASGSKKRPVLVLWLDDSDVVVSAVTTAAPRSTTDIALAEWKKSGLRRASTVRLSRLDCLEQSLLIGRIGSIAKADAESVKRAWSTHIGPQF